MIRPPDLSLTALAPQLLLSGWAMVVLLLAAFLPPARKGAVSWVAFAGVIAAALAVSLVATPALGVVTAAGAVTWDVFGSLACLVFLAGAAIAILLSDHYLKDHGIARPEYYALVLFCTAGAMVMATSLELISLFIGLELLSLSMYVLAGFATQALRSEEAALKYFLLGAFASGFMIYGVAMLYGATGSTFLPAIQARMGVHYLALAGLALILVGLGFKVAVVPFHMWTPDVYEGAPTPVTAFMSVIAKAAGFAALMRVAHHLLPANEEMVSAALWAIAAATMALGNVLALVQANIKRMLAYSSIAHAGYVLMAVLAGDRANGAQALLFYLLAYTLMNLGAFAVVIYLARGGQEYLEVEDLSGLAVTQPWAAGAMAAFMFSLAGLPPTAGFVAKFYVFAAALRAGYPGLTVLAVICTVVGFYYYLRIVVLMYMRPPGKAVLGVWPAPAVAAAIAICAIATLALGLFPAGTLALAQAAGLRP